MFGNAMARQIAVDHLSSMEFDGETRIGKVKEALAKGQVQYSVALTFKMDDRASWQVVESEPIPMSYPPELIPELLPHIFTILCLHGVNCMNEVMKETYGELEE